MSGARLLAVTWWCHTIQAPWSWSPRGYVGVWLIVALAAGGYLWAVRRHARHTPLDAKDRRARIWFFLGLAIFWIASDWPLATLGGAYLLSAHVAIYVMYTVAAAPLLLLGIRPWMARPVLDRLHAWGAYRLVDEPWIAGVQLNVVLIVTHLPPVVNALRSNQAGSFLLDATWVVSALIAWLPVCGPFPGDRIRHPFLKCIYLFVAFQVFPMLPGSMITFSSLPVYRIYELAPRLGSWTPQQDQQLAGALMVVAATPVIWTIIAVIFLRAFDTPTPVPPAATGAASPSVAPDGLVPGR